MGGIRPFLIALFTFYHLLLKMADFSDALSDMEMCEQCQKVLYRAFLYYRVQTTKRLLRHKLKHLCNRYFEYRRHCLITMLPHVELIWANMEKVLDEDRTHEFKPYGTCAAIKECDKEHQPLTTFGPDDGVALEEAGTTNDANSSSSDNTTTKMTTETTPSSSWSTTTTTEATTATTTEEAATAVAESESESLLMLDFF